MFVHTFDYRKYCRCSAHSRSRWISAYEALLLCYSCPFDYVNVYDGADNESAVIGTYCGQQRNLVLYSSESSLLVTFVTLQRTASTQNRGFKGIFEFSESFVKLGMFCIFLLPCFVFQFCTF